MGIGTTSERKATNSGHVKRDMGIIGLLFSAVGSIIGSGWLFGALLASQAAGPGSIVSWCIGAVMIIFIALCYAELGTMFPVSGGAVRFPHFCFGSFASYTLGWVSWLSAAATTAIEVMAALQYSSNYVPWLEHLDQTGAPVLTHAGFAVAIGLLALFSAINVFGVRWFARLNNALVWWKLFIITLVVVVFLLAGFKAGNFTDAAAGGFVPFGWEGVLSATASAGIVFSYNGFRQGVELAGETRNPQRNVSIAIIGSVVITAVIYVALQIAFIGALPEGALVNGWANVGTSFTGGMDHIAAAFGPLAALATVMGLAWLAGLLYLDAFVSPADTSFVFTTVTARLSYAMGRNGNSPRALTKLNARGVPWVGLIVTFVAGAIFLLPFPGWGKLVGFITSAAVLSFGASPLALVALRRQLPNQPRPFRLPGAHILAYLAFLSSNLIVYWSGWDTVWKLMVAVLIGYVILAIHEGRFHRETPKLEWRSGAWVPVWFAGLTLITWLGAHPESDVGANSALLGFGWSCLVIAVFSALVMWMATALRLPADVAKAYVSERAA